MEYVKTAGREIAGRKKTARKGRTVGREIAGGKKTARKGRTVGRMKIVGRKARKWLKKKRNAISVTIQNDNK